MRENAQCRISWMRIRTQQKMRAPKKKNYRTLEYTWIRSVERRFKIQKKGSAGGSTEFFVQLIFFGAIPAQLTRNRVFHIGKPQTNNQAKLLMRHKSKDLQQVGYFPHIFSVFRPGFFWGRWLLTPGGGVDLATGKENYFDHFFGRNLPGAIRSMICRLLPIIKNLRGVILFGAGESDLGKEKQVVKSSLKIPELATYRKLSQITRLIII